MIGKYRESLMFRLLLPCDRQVAYNPETGGIPNNYTNHT